MTNQECLQSWRAHFASRCALCPVHQADVALAQLLLEAPPAAKEAPVPVTGRGQPARRATRSGRTLKRPAPIVKEAATRSQTPTFERSRKRGAGKHDARVLAALEKSSGGFRASALAKQVGITTENMYPALRRLVQRGTLLQNGRLYRLKKFPAPASTDAPKPDLASIWTGKKDDPSLIGDRAQAHR